MYGREVVSPSKLWNIILTGIFATCFFNICTKVYEIVYEIKWEFISINNERFNDETNKSN